MYDCFAWHQSRAIVKSFSKHPLFLIKAIIVAHLVFVQSFGIFKMLTNKNYCTVWLNFLKIAELWTATKCTWIITLTEVMGVLKTSWQRLLNGVKQQICTVLFQYAMKALSWQVFRFLGGPQVRVPSRYPKNIFSILFWSNMGLTKPKYWETPHILLGNCLSWICQVCL